MKAVLGNEVNMVIHRLREKDEPNDVDVFRAIHNIQDYYYIFSPTRKTIQLTKDMNKMHDFGFDYDHLKSATGITFQELLLKAMAFKPSDPFSYLQKHCVMIPKIDEVEDFLDSIDVMNKLTGKKSGESIAKDFKIFPDSFRMRIHKLFDKTLNKIVGSHEMEGLHRQYAGQTYEEFDNGKTKIEFTYKIIQGIPQESFKETFLRREDKEEVSRLVDHNLLKLFNELRPFNQVVKTDVNVIRSVEVVKSVTSDVEILEKVMDVLDWETTIFRSDSILFEHSKYTKKADYRRPSHFKIHVGIVFDYNQYCDLAERSL